MTKPISMDKQYKTRDGLVVRLLCVDRPHEQFPVVALVGEGIQSYTADGRWYVDHEQHRFDLIEVSPWDFPIDTPVLVRDADDTQWNKRYFAGVTPDGKAKAFNRGATSWSGNETTTWNQCIKADV